jgi:5-amino-6-(5-phospho-D-ribitylamino)uracil phosphatase
MTYAITLDIDGTLLNRDGALSELTIKTIEKLIKKGHLVMLATGRPLGGAMPIYRALNLKTPIVTDNGSCIDHPSDDLFPSQRTYMPVKVMHQLFLEAKPYLISAFFNVEDIVYAYQYSHKLWRLKRDSNPRPTA